MKCGSKMGSKGSKPMAAKMGGKGYGVTEKKAPKPKGRKK